MIATPWSNFTRAIVIFVCLIVFVWLVYVIRPVIGPLTIAGLLAYVLNPLVRLVQSRVRLKRERAVSLVYFSCLALLIVIPSILTPVGLRQASRLSTNLIDIETQLETALEQPVNIAGRPLYLGQVLADFLKTTSETFMPAGEETLALLETTSINLAWLLVILVSTYSFLLHGARLRDWLVHLAPHAMQPDTRRLLWDIDLVWRAYVQGTFVLMIIVGAVFTVVWFAIGLPGALVLGLLMGFLTIIPDIGPAIGAVLSALVAFFQGSDFLPMSNFWFAVLVFTLYFVLIQIKGIWLRPRIMSRFLHMNEGLILVAILAATVIWGILGALIIVPLLSTFGIIVRYVRCRLLHLEPWPKESSASSLTLEEKIDASETEFADIVPES